MAFLDFIPGISSIAGSIASYQGQKHTNKTNIQLAKEGREHDVNMWNKQNEYNTPDMQMQRLKEAGLNPNLIYGSGQASAGNADAPKQAHVANTSNEMATFANNNAIQLLSQYNDWQVKKAQIKNIEAEAQSKQQENLIRAPYVPYSQLMANIDYSTKYNKNELTNTASNRAQMELEDYFKTRETHQQMPLARLNESKQRTNYLQQRARQTQIGADLDEMLKPHGMTSSDQLWQRLLGPSLIPLIKKGEKSILNLFK